LLATGHGISPFAGGFEQFPVGVTIAAFIAFWKFKADIMKVIGGCALLGSVYSDAR
jgi:chromate transporter